MVNVGAFPRRERQGGEGEESDGWGSKDKVPFVVILYHS